MRGVGVIEGQECLITGSAHHEKEADSCEVHAPTTVKVIFPEWAVCDRPPPLPIQNCNDLS